MGISLPDFGRFFSKTEELSDTWAGIGLHVDGVSAVIIQRFEEPTVTNWGYEKLAEGELLSAALERLSNKLGLEDIACTTWLDEHDYQIKLTDAPEVDDGDIGQALTWQAEDIFDEIGENPVVESIEFPGQSAGDEQVDQLYVIGASHDDVQLRSDLLFDAGMKLRCIDVAEMCQRNIAELVSSGPRGIATVSFTNESCLITISKDDVLYMTRRLSVGLTELQDSSVRTEKLEQVMIELQRSLDYYSSHLRQAPVEKIYLAPLESPVPELSEAVRTHLYLEPAEINLGRLMTWEIEMPPRLQARLFYSIGAALRLEPMEFDEEEEPGDEDIFA